MTNSPTNLENAERAEMTMTPHAYAQEYEFRGDTDYTPSDFERTMIEDAILGYLGEARIAERAEMEPKVKPLEWRVEGENRNGPWLWEASSIVKGYTIRHMPNDLYKLDGHGEWATLKAAKAAAQSDFDARIRSCLLDKPEAGEGEPVAWASSKDYRKNHLMSAAQYRSALPKNRVDFDIPLYAQPSSGLEDARKALALCAEVIEYSSFQWVGAGPHPQVAIEAARAAIARAGEEG